MSATPKLLLMNWTEPPLTDKRSKLNSQNPAVEAVVAVVIVTAVMEVAVIAVGVADLVAEMADATAGMAVGVTATEAVEEVAMMAEGTTEVVVEVADVMTMMIVVTATEVTTVGMTTNWNNNSQVLPKYKCFDLFFSFVSTKLIKE